MTREEHLKFCRKCTNRKMDVQQGLVCNLTGLKANFETECPDFTLDETVNVESIEQTEAMMPDEAMLKLSPEIYEKLKLEQNLVKAILGGTVVGIIGAVLWGIITVSTGYQIGYMAVAIGAGVGFTIRYLGKGLDQIFGISGGLIALLSCVAGNVLSIIGFIANNEGLGYLETINLLNFDVLTEIMIDSFTVMDLFFYGIAIFEGYKFSFRQITEKDIDELTKR